MGQKHSQSSHSPIINWQQHPNDPNTLINLLTHEQIRRYYVKVMNYQQLCLYNNRLYQHYTYICRVVYYHSEESFEISTPRMYGQNFPKYFYVYTDCMLPLTEWTMQTTMMVMRGFRRLFNIYGPMRVDPSMIGQNQRGQIKVWVNRSSIINHPKGIALNQQQMLADLAAILIYCDKKSAGLLIACKTFTQAIRNLAQFQQQMKQQKDQHQFQSSYKNSNQLYSYRQQINSWKSISDLQDTSGQRFKKKQKINQRHLSPTMCNDSWTVRRNDSISKSKHKPGKKIFQYVNPNTHTRKSHGGGSVSKINSSQGFSKTSTQNNRRFYTMANIGIEFQKPIKIINKEDISPSSPEKFTNTHSGYFPYHPKHGDLNLGQSSTLQYSISDRYDNKKQFSIPVKSQNRIDKKDQHHPFEVFQNPNQQWCFPQSLFNQRKSKKQSNTEGHSKYAFNQSPKYLFQGNLMHDQTSQRKPREKNQTFTKGSRIYKHHQNDKSNIIRGKTQQFYPKGRDNIPSFIHRKREQVKGQILSQDINYQSKKDNQQSQTNNKFKTAKLTQEEFNTKHQRMHRQTQLGKDVKPNNGNLQLAEPIRNHPIIKLKSVHRHSNSSTHQPNPHEDLLTRRHISHAEEKGSQKHDLDSDSEESQKRQVYGCEEISKSAETQDSKRKQKREANQQIKKQFGSILSWGRDEQTISSSDCCIKGYKGHQELTQQDGEDLSRSQQHCEPISCRTKDQSEVSVKDIRGQQNNKDNTFAHLSRTKDKIKKKVEQKKVTFAELKQEALKLLTDDFF